MTKLSSFRAQAHAGPEQRLALCQRISVAIAASPRDRHAAATALGTSKSTLRLTLADLGRWASSTASALPKSRPHSMLRRLSRGDAAQRKEARLMLVEAMSRTEGRKELAAAALDVGIVTFYRAIWDLDEREPGFADALAKQFPCATQGGEAWAAARARGMVLSSALEET